jgi:electron transfer flavoprotein beta subunit
VRALEIVVCVKSVPDPKRPGKVSLDPDTGRVSREADQLGIARVMSPLDGHALEEAFRIREARGGRVTTLTMDLPAAQEVMLESLALGADRAVLLSDPGMAGADTLATARTLAAAITKLGRYDLVLCGAYSYHGNTGQVGPQLAELLSLPHIPYVCELSVLAPDCVKATSELDDRYLVYEARLPLLLTVTSALNEVRGVSLMGIVRAREKELVTWRLPDTGLEAGEAGQAISPTRVVGFSTFGAEREGQMLRGEPTAMVSGLLEHLRRRRVL